MSPSSAREALIAAVSSAWRERSPEGHLREAPAWHDLDDAGRREAFAVTVLLRQAEAARHPSGLSGTGQAVLARIRAGLGQVEP